MLVCLFCACVYQEKKGNVLLFIKSWHAFGPMRQYRARDPSCFFFLCSAAKDESARPGRPWRPFALSRALSCSNLFPFARASPFFLNWSPHFACRMRCFLASFGFPWAHRSPRAVGPMCLSDALPKWCASMTEACRKRQTHVKRATIDVRVCSPRTYNHQCV